jgi:hypothetical protein
MNFHDLTSECTPGRSELLLGRAISAVEVWRFPAGPDVWRWLGVLVVWLMLFGNFSAQWLRFYATPYQVYGGRVDFYLPG